MLNRFLAMAITIGALGSASRAVAQEATEMFIPIGQSPGISNKTTVIGTVDALNASARTVTVAGPSGPQTFAISDKTRIWLDRSVLKQTNQSGSLADLRQGRKVEIKLPPAGSEPGADWIKVQVPAGSG